MTADEANELVRDLQRAGVRVLGVDPQPEHPGEVQIRCWYDCPAHEYAVTNAVLFRQAVRDGLIEELPRNAL